MKENKEFTIDTIGNDLETGITKLNSTYRDEYLMKLRQRHEELTILNQQLKLEAEKFLKKESRNS